MKIYITELSNEELKKVYEANGKLQSKIHDLNYDSAMECARDIIDCFDDNCIKYRLGYDRGALIKCVDESAFIHGCIEAQKNYGLFTDEDYKMVENAVDLYDIMGRLEAYGVDTDSIENEIAKICDILADIMYNYFADDFEDALFNDERGIETLIDIYAEAYYDDCYINDEDGDYILYRDTVESFK